MQAQSLPARERGLKHLRRPVESAPLRVAPRAGAWIEAPAYPISADTVMVAPRAGAWIEAAKHGRGGAKDRVAPRAGAWIEASYSSRSKAAGWGRSPRGSVD